MENMPNEKSYGAVEKGGQYSLARILGIWALAAVPMGIKIVHSAQSVYFAFLILGIVLGLA
jgi:hypothetical protein